MKDLVVFLNGTRGVAVLAALLEAGHEVSAIVTPPNASSDLVCRFPVTHLKMGDLNGSDAIGRLGAYAPSLFVVAGFSTIMKRELFNIPRYGTINLHAGPLPQYRGGSPLNWQLINGETQAGISIIQLDDGIDTGPVLAEARFEIGPKATIADLHDTANELFPRLVLSVLDSLESGSLTARKQVDADASYWHQRSDADGQLNFCSLTAVQVERMIRALTRPYPGAWATFDGRRIRLLAAEIPELTLRGVPGRVCFIRGGGPYVCCADRAILLTEYSIEGGGTLLRHGVILN